MNTIRKERIDRLYQDLINLIYGDEISFEDKGPELREFLERVYEEGDQYGWADDIDVDNLEQDESARYPEENELPPIARLLNDRDFYEKGYADALKEIADLEKEIAELKSGRKK